METQTSSNFINHKNVMIYLMVLWKLFVKMTMWVNRLFRSVGCIKKVMRELLLSCRVWASNCFLDSLSITLAFTHIRASGVWCNCRFAMSLLVCVYSRPKLHTLIFWRQHLKNGPNNYVSHQIAAHRRAALYLRYTQTNINRPRTQTSCVFPLKRTLSRMHNSWKQVKWAVTHSPVQILRSVCYWPCDLFQV